MLSILHARLIVSVLIAATFALLTACATQPFPERGVVDADALNDDEGIVFGILAPRYHDSRGRQLTGDAVPDLPYEVYYGEADSVTMKRVFSGFSRSISGNAQQAQTFFAMQLPAGTYSLFKLYRPLGNTTGAVPIDVRFTVTPGKATYIGSLQIDFRATRGLFGSEQAGEKVAFEVIDETPDATREYTKRNPDAPRAIVTGLMKIKKQ